MMAEQKPERPFMSERRAIGLLGAAVLATVAYGVVTGISLLEGAIFFVIFALVFTALNYAVWRWD
mgnify:CR=1 FL=1